MLTVLHVTLAVVFGCFFAFFLPRGKINPLCANEKKGNCSLGPLLNTFPAGVSVHVEKIGPVYSCFSLVNSTILKLEE